MQTKHILSLCRLYFAFILLSACAPEPQRTATSLPFTPTPTTPPPSRTPEPEPTLTPTPEPPLVLEPAGCKKPPDDYSHVQVNHWELNQRTYAMLQYAAQLYTGPIDLANTAITQGSYSSNGPASFGTHLGGGAVDISVITPGGRLVLYNEIEPAIKALRAAGFAAWLRDWNELGQGSGIHIHAIAIGDAELSDAATEQLTGPFGYFRGYSGVPTSDGIPIPDRHGGPVICQWMREQSYTDLRPKVDNPPTNWPANLKQAAEAYIVADAEQSIEVAQRLDFRPGNNEHSSNMCGPLAAAILRDAGLLPVNYGPVTELRNYWLADPQITGRPWTLFPPHDYELFHFDTAINKFDFAAWPLRPADFLYTYQGKDGYEHMFIVTEVDAQGRAYTVTNNKQPDLTYIIQKVMLYDPNDPTVGTFKKDWVKSPKIGRTGLQGFDVLRKKGVSLPSGSRYNYSVEPSDTLQTIAAKFSSEWETIAQENQLASPYALSVGQTIVVPVNISLP